MEQKRRNQIIFFFFLVALAVVHFLWGKQILKFLSTTILHWIITIIVVLMLVGAVVAIITNHDVSYKACDSYLEKIKKEYTKKEKEEDDG